MPRSPPPECGPGCRRAVWAMVSCCATPGTVPSGPCSARSWGASPGWKTPSAFFILLGQFPGDGRHVVVQPEVEVQPHPHASLRRRTARGGPAPAGPLHRSRRIGGLRHEMEGVHAGRLVSLTSSTSPSYHYFGPPPRGRGESVPGHIGSHPAGAGMLQSRRLAEWPDNFELAIRPASSSCPGVRGIPAAVRAGRLTLTSSPFARPMPEQSSSRCPLSIWSPRCSPARSETAPPLPWAPPRPHRHGKTSGGEPLAGLPDLQKPSYPPAG